MADFESNRGPQGLAALDQPVESPVEERGGRSALGVNTLRKLGAMFLVVVAVMVIVGPELTLEQLDPLAMAETEGEILSPVKLERVDAEALQEARQQIRDESLKVYLHRKTGESEWRRVNAAFDSAVRINESLSEAPEEEKRAALATWFQERQLDTPSDRGIGFLLRRAQSSRVRSMARSVYVGFLDDKGILENDKSRSALEGLASRERLFILDWGKVYPDGNSDRPAIKDLRGLEPATRDRVGGLVEFRNVTEALRRAAAGVDREIDARAFAEFLTVFVPSNVFLSRQLTDGEYERQFNAIRPQMIKIDPGDVLFDTRNTSALEREELIEEANRKIERINIIRLGFFLGLLVSMMAFMAVYVTKFQGELSQSPADILAISSAVVIPLFVGRLLVFVSADPDAAGFAFPAALVGMLGVILVDPRFALVLVVCASTLFGIAMGIGSENTFNYLVVALAGGFAAVSSLLAIRRRRDVLLAGIRSGVVSYVSVIGVNFLTGDPRWLMALAGFSGGFISSVLVYPCLFVLERFAGQMTDIALMEFDDTRHPLLRQLEERAPGTYQHTLNVAGLAEAASESIGANTLLVRVGCLFHDIGKMDKPKYFSENQVSPEDRKAHDKLSPHMSALIIKEHVKSGYEKAKKAGLPPRVIDFIPEHHGTTTIAFFYHKALKIYEESESNDPVKLEHFKYAGPPPQSRETAIALLADSIDAVAAAKLSGAKVDRDDIRRLVRDVINQKFREEQFDQCHLTLRDLSIMQEAFVRTLEARYHHRVKYPGPPPRKKAGDSAAEVRSRSKGRKSEKRGEGTRSNGERKSVKGEGS